MGKTSRKTRESFKESAIKIHGDFYDYSLVDYKNNKTPVKILCPLHGEFFQSPTNHLYGKGCVKCSRKKSNKWSTEDFIYQSKETHGNKYDYSKCEYNGGKGKVLIICPDHGEFLQEARSHKMGCGCPDCGRIKSDISRRKTKKEFLEEAIKKHGTKYDYSLVSFNKVHDLVKIKCPYHGIFLQSVTNHLSGQGCYNCGIHLWGSMSFFNKYPELKDSPCIFYILKIFDDKEKFLKIGFTRKTLEDRYKGLSNKGYYYEELFQFESTFEQCARIESELLFIYKNRKYKPKNKFCGSTECIDFSFVNQLFDSTDNLLNKQ